MSFVVAHCHDHEVVDNVIVGYVNQEAFSHAKMGHNLHLYIRLPRAKLSTFHIILNIYYNEIQQ